MIAGLLALVSPILGKVLDKIPDAGEREKVRLEFELKLREQEAALLTLFTQNDQGQIDVNKVEAASSNLFVSGWRPAVGWVCAFGVAWAFVLQPGLDWLLAIVKPGVTTPQINAGELMSLLLGMLGMGAIRSFEKVRGVSR